MERLSCLAHDSNYRDEVVCGMLWKPIDGEPCALNAQTKDGFEFLFARAVKGISDFSHKYTAF